jgi:hypothetical protein
MAAVRFVKEMAEHVDKKNGVAPTRGTQKKVAAVVRENFFTPTASADSWPAREPPSVAIVAGRWRRNDLGARMKSASLSRAIPWEAT